MFIPPPEPEPEPLASREIEDENNDPSFVGAGSITADASSTALAASYEAVWGGMIGVDSGSSATFEEEVVDAAVAANPPFLAAA
jgi:hypothetical protein